MRPTHFRGYLIDNYGRGYPRIWFAGGVVYIHILIWEEANGPKPEGFDVHHKDKDKWNWGLENLELLSKSDHQKTHRGWIKTDGSWSHKPCSQCKRVLLLEDFFASSKASYGVCKECHKVRVYKWRENNRERYLAGRKKLREANK